ncbi:MAG: DUF4383 domain-containing protein, partial [Actinomycetota bacterium]|nr:DUF4383 domain-containing protein [Actinomycetota bacterium]
MFWRPARFTPLHGPAHINHGPREDNDMVGNAATGSHARELPQLLALGFGAVYVLVGLIGFLVTGFSGFAEPNTDKLLLGIFEVNPFHNVAHLLTGMTGLLLGRTLAGAR